jgi:alcohol dehydrogenase
MNWSHHNPVRLECAPLERLAQHVQAKHVLLVTTPGFVCRGLAQHVRELLAPCQVTVWDGVKPNPDLQDLDAATSTLKPLGIECIVGLGGGSALDAAKVLATTLLAPASPSLCDVFRFGVEAPWVSRLPLVLVPTTSGTGSEVTPFATVWDHSEHKKHSLTGRFIFPDLALLDAQLTLSLSEDNTLYPALDAISHALESLWNKNCTPISRAFAFQALSLSNQALPVVLNDPQAIQARQNLQAASVLAGIAISQTRTAIAHSISYPLTSHYGIPHGLACSFTLPALLHANLPTLPVHEGERLHLEKTQKLLISLGLSKRISKYVNGQQLLAVENEMLTLGRADNYQGAEQINLRELLAGHLSMV